jgi:hypothetical protein
VHVAGDLVLLDQARAEQQRVIGAERYRDPGRDQPPDRNRSLVRLDAKRHVGRRAHLTGNLPGRQPLEQPGILDGAYAVPKPAGVQPVERRPDAGRPNELPGVRDEE